MSNRPYRVALNGYGRIGRCVLRALHERGAGAGLEIVALNDLADQASIEYLTRFDSTHGRFPGEVKVDGDCLHINGDCVKVLRQREPEAIDWAALDIDLLLECSGQYVTRAEAQRFIDAGAPRLLLSQPMASEADIDATVVYGVNQACLSGRELLVSNASCTTNCSVPLLKLLDESVGLEYVSITTIHSAMNDQPVIDAYHHEDLRRTRSAFQSVIPVSTGLARGIERLLPELAGRVQAKAIRVPTVNVSCLDITLQTARDTSAAEINSVLRQAAEAGPLKGLLAYTELPHASCDFNHDPHSAIVDGSQTRVSGPRLVNLLAWFDNEWGFANRMLDVAEHFLAVSTSSAQLNLSSSHFSHVFKQTFGITPLAYVARKRI
ncbi:erythrose-4-phosphate dehydrogenase, partial [Ectopseudomonas hydrolytica]|uniref:erythrose-4-phosphate dehydrogenase n=1 Tax=Ectopseudomonas hydrolytica TaxID=2493633 RepID=UPI003C2B2773